MSVQKLPEGMWVKRQDFGSIDHDLEFSGGDAGASQVVINGPQRWTCSLISEELLDAEQAAMWRSLILSLRGRTGFLEVYDILNSEPRGTLRGQPTLASPAPAGSSSLTINAGAGQAGRTLKRGDWLGVLQGTTNRQLLHVQEDAVADSRGQITVRFAPVLRAAVGAGSPVAWDKPTCLMRREDQATSWSSSGAVQGGFSLELKEHWF